MKKLLLVGLLCVAGCRGVSKEDFATWASKHDAALSSAIDHLDNADSHLTQSPPAVPEARKEIGEAKGDLGVVRDVASEVTDAAQNVVADRDKIKEDFFSPRQKAWAAGIGATLALLGIVVVLLRYGRLGGILASVPLLGILLARIGLGPKRK